MLYYSEMEKVYPFAAPATNLQMNDPKWKTATRFGKAI